MTKSNTRFNDFIKKHPSLEKILPLIHTTDGYSGRDIIDNKELCPDMCPVFNENLLYFFYGRPAYRVGDTKNATSQICFMPVCFVLKPEAVSSIKRIFPFDSGAFNRNMFEKYMHPKMKKEDFFLDISLDMASRVVSFFYGSNYKYYSGEVQQPEIPCDQFEVESYYQLIADKNKTDHDDRCSTIELQTDNVTRIIKDNILLLVLPICFLDDKNVKQFITEWGVKYIGYKTYHGKVLEYMSELRKIVEDFLKEKGYF